MMFWRKKPTPDMGAISMDMETSAYGSVHISVYDPGTQQDHIVDGPIITNLSGASELTGDLRNHILATASGQIFYSQSQRDNPIVQSHVARLALRFNPDSVRIRAVDASTISEFYRRESSGKASVGEKKTNDNSRMQREMIAIVANASALNSSDIHIIVNMGKAVVRFRVDGVIREINELPPQYAFELLSAAFAMADASDASYQSLQYQGARVSNLKTELPTGVQSLRLQFNPLANEGRYLIIRLLYSGEGKQVSLEQLGYNQMQVKKLATMSAKPVGINIVSGPTGSGKSTTLKALLERVISMRGGEVNTLTIEDPPEYVIEMAQQMPVTNAKTQEERNAAFTAAINAGLRSDPDIMMIGEVRDRASADLAVEGALSGHPIYASLHANTAMDILSRLRDMGLDDYNVFDENVMSGLVGQRLVRKICPNCRIPLSHAINEQSVDELVLERIEKMREVTPQRHRDTEIYLAGPGCSECSNGYNGRSVLSEIIIPDNTFMSLMKAGNKTDARSHWFKTLEGIDLLGSAWIRCLQGFISPVDIENTVALLDPTPEHEGALERWSDHS
jgi:type II secretory ATPase GspE/PulE/Tfp pilus assembly ATPase PilB-like protein